MIINMTLGEIFEKCNDWEYFCKEEDWSEWAITEGGSKIEIYLTEVQAHKYGLLKSNE